MFSALPVAAFSVNFASASRTAEVGSFTSARTVTALTSVTLAPQVAASSSFFENFNTTENIQSPENLVIENGKVALWLYSDGSSWLFARWGVRWRHSSVVFDNKMWVLGGKDDSNYYCCFRRTTTTMTRLRWS